MQEAVGTTTANNRRPFGWGILGTANIAKTFVKAVQTLNKDQVLRLDYLSCARFFRIMFDACECLNSCPSLNSGWEGRGRCESGLCGQQNRGEGTRVGQ